MHSVDVLIPVYNNERTIADSIESILKQSFSDFRVVVVDDGSTDGTGEILSRIATRDTRVVVVKRKNGGIVEALNTGLEYCTAEFLARLDGDDIAYPDRFETQVRYLEEHPDCIAVSNRVLHVDGEGNRIGQTQYFGDAVSNLDAVPVGEPYLMHSFLMVRRRLVQQVGGYRHVLYAEDTDLYFRLEHIGRLHVMEDRLGEVRVHTGSTTSRSLRNVRCGAVYSQLSGISAKRHARGKEDIPFTRALASRVSSANSLAQMVEIAAEGLEAEERDYLEVATAAKMLQLRVYRKFHFAWRDVRTIAAYLARHRSMIPMRDTVILLKTPFWYFYRPRAYMVALSRMLGI